MPRSGFRDGSVGLYSARGESFEYGRYRFSVMEMDGRRVARVKIQRVTRGRAEESRSSRRDCPRRFCSGCRNEKISPKERNAEPREAPAILRVTSYHARSE